MNEKFKKVFKLLDYVNINYYPGYFNFKKYNTPEKQVNLIIKKNLFEFISKNKFVVLGESGWQSYNKEFEKSNNYNLVKYYLLLLENLKKSNFSFMFYFNFCDQSWKEKDNYWGLFFEGNKNKIGNLKYNFNLMAEVSVIDSSTTLSI